MKLIFEKSIPGRRGVTLPADDLNNEVPVDLPAEQKRKKPAELPEVSLLDAVRHFTHLSHRNFSIDSHFYPLGSCTMKYNPMVCEEAARIPGFAQLHPLAHPDDAQGALRLIHNLEKHLSSLCGMDAFCLWPLAGAHGEYLGVRLIRAYHESREPGVRKKILVPDSAHGTNPASAALCGYQVVEVRSNANGTVDLGHLDELLDGEVAGMMLTNPNTLGLFERDILTIAERVHAAGGLLYYDGANLNAIVGRYRPGDMGFDVVHMNLHKTMSTPHGGGGPGSGPVGVKSHLIPYLPIPRVVEKDGRFSIQEDAPDSIGRIGSFYGNFGIYVRGYTFMRMHGLPGLCDVSAMAVLNANYVMKAVSELFEIPYPGPCMHEFVASLARESGTGVHAMDLAKRLLDLGFHAPTVYFPLLVKEGMLIEPTETESRETLDAFIAALKQIKEEMASAPERVTGAPRNVYATRLDDVKAARKPDLALASFSDCDA